MRSHPEGTREEEEAVPQQKYRILNNTLSGHVSHESDCAKLGGSCSCRVNTVLEALGIGDCFY